MAGEILVLGFFGMSPGEMMICGVVAVILFGSRLPSVARSLGKSMSEFKKGMRDFEGQMNDAVYSEPKRRVAFDDTAEADAPRFEPPES